MTDSLTGRERQLLTLLADGCTQAAIAREMCVTDRTVRRAIRRLTAKLGANGAAELVAAAPLRSWDEMVRQWRAAGYQVALIPIPGAKGLA